MFHDAGGARPAVPGNMAAVFLGIIEAFRFRRFVRPPCVLENLMAAHASPGAELPPQTSPALRVMPMPADVNPQGDVFGGWIMAQVDVAGAIPAMQRARGRVTTVAVNSFLFKQPVSVGDVVSFFAEVVDTGRTSIKVRVEVYAERHPAQPIIVKVTEAVLTYVAINQHGAKRELQNDQ